jgi:hypothetical protein
MTGRELIIYILRNGLEGEEIFKDGTFVGFYNAEQLAAKFYVGVETVKLWTQLGMLKHITVGEEVFYPRDIEDPRKSRS